MCSSPIHIKNNSFSGSVNSPIERTVPCGKCESCRNKYINEWFLRSYYHYKYYTEVLKGCVSFITLTHNNTYLPKYEDGDFSMPCFSKWMIQRFIKYLRRYAKKNWKYTVNQCQDITSLICSEFGSKSTQRPHYHGLVFLPTTICSFELLKALKYAWSVVEGSRKNPLHIPIGWVSFGRVNGKITPFVQNLSALKYVVKYTAKDFGMFDDVHGLRKYCENSANYDKVKPYLPFHLQSRGYGLFALRVLTDEDFIHGYVKDPLPPTKDGKKDFDHTITLPDYYKRKFYFAKSLQHYNNCIGLFQHSFNYYRTLKKRLLFEVVLQFHRFKTLLSSPDEFRKVYPSTTFDEDMFSLSVIESYNRIKEVLSTDAKILDYCYYRLLSSFSVGNINISSKTYLLNVLSFLHRKQAQIHDFNVNHYNMCLITRDYKEMKVVINDDPLQEFSERVMKYGFINNNGLQVDLSQFDNMFVSCEFPCYFNYVEDEDTKVIYKSMAKKYLTPQMEEYLKKGTQWFEFPRFFKFDLVSKIFSRLDECFKPLKDISKANKRHFDKQVTDSANKKFYG